MIFYPSERGQGLLEYAMAIVLIAIIVIIVLTIVGRAVNDLFTNVIISV